ncbi:MAG: hypothetical protein PF517_17180 [Salinivirgaceae bacterium]|jgi:uncharacterized membrane protein YhaH (DUF805 family)|nr:hypothetical protein [Salinivirgaceae bacterium]
MSSFSKYLIVVAFVGLVGAPIFIIDFNDLSWIKNQEVYWGMIAMLALIGAVVFNHRASIIQNNIETGSENSDKNENK